MTKKILLVILTVITASSAFAQEDAAFAAMPKNAVAIDVMPMISGSMISNLGNLFANTETPNTYVFGIAAHYERHISESFTVGGRFSYMGGDMWYAGNDGFLGMNVNTFSAEAHGRFYAGSVFFFDVMMGYANMTTAFTGLIEDPLGSSTPKYVSPTISRDFFLLGAKLGWRIDFGDPGGFFFEPALAWNFAMGGPDTVGKKFADATGSSELGDGMDLLFMIYENFLFVGGPRLNLNLGWRF